MCSIDNYVSQPAIVQVGRVFFYTYVNTALEIPLNSRATCMVVVCSKTRLDKHETSCCVHIVCCALSQQRAATYRKVPQRAACHTVEERVHYANFYIALEINSNNCPKQRGISHCGVKLRLKHVETRHSVYKSSKSVHSCRLGATSRKSTFNR